ncbi:uncharacterized protein LOC141854254 isoform X2 [Brevipalpus obovatus]|uniref:uncharacterized protein LOC141854254 isoform X2 n=1 Tax=Brevipalpus obovatus TaxID=246614 RepID=UPI003D9E10F4
MRKWLVLIALFVVACADDYEYDLNQESMGNSLEDGESNDKISIRWKDLGWKIVCEEDEWKSQFDSIRDEFLQCTHLGKIMYDHDADPNLDRRMDFDLTFGKIQANPYCRLAKYWKKCRSLLDGLECLEPYPRSLLNERRRAQYKEITRHRTDSVEIVDSYDWRAMQRPYRILCDIAKTYSKVNPLEALGAF